MKILKVKINNYLIRIGRIIERSRSFEFESIICRRKYIINKENEK